MVALFGAMPNIDDMLHQTLSPSNVRTHSSRSQLPFPSHIHLHTGKRSTPSNDARHLFSVRVLREMHPSNIVGIEVLQLV